MKKIIACLCFFSALGCNNMMESFNNFKAILNIGANSTAELTQKLQINKTNFAKAYPSLSYQSISDIFIVPVDRSLLPENTPKSILQTFFIDNSKKSIFYSLDGKTITEYTDPVNMQNPVAIAVTAKGDIIIADKSAKQVIKYVYDGQRIKFNNIILTNIGATDIAIDKGNNLYVIDDIDSKLIKIDINGNPINFTDLSSNIIMSYIDSTNTQKNLIGLRAVTVDEDGNIYSIGNYGRLLVKYKSGGSTDTVLYLSAILSPVDIAISKNNVILVSQVKNQLILLNKDDLSFIGVINPVEYSYPWGKMQDMRRIMAYPSKGAIVVLDKEGGALFLESSIQ
ncbi:MAG: hypothetical protein A2W19_16300 [Spirochaetes bacterium RBG_16_49_21]|nr:MAG: hypothetical protein A2W19_16300 [Spirochaetes bacterium RBG_16_49_21]